MFTMVLTRGSVRENHIVEFEEGRCIAWLPADPGQPPPGHIWRWELERTRDTTTMVTHLLEPERERAPPSRHGCQTGILARSALVHANLPVRLSIIPP